MNEMSLVYKMSNIVSLLMELVVDCRRLDRNVSFKTTFNMPCLQALTFFGDFLLLFVANQNHGDTLFTLFSLLAHSQYTLDGHLLSADFARRL
jgi:hypothetical protein